MRYAANIPSSHRKNDGCLFYKSTLIPLTELSEPVSAVCGGIYRSDWFISYESGILNCESCP